MNADDLALLIAKYKSQGLSSQEIKQRIDDIELANGAEDHRSDEEGFSELY